MNPVHRLEYVVVDSNPLQGPDGNLYAHYAGLPDWALDTLFTITDKVDATRCTDCGDTIGYAVTVDDHVQWQPTWLVREDDGPVAKACGECMGSALRITWQTV